MNASSDVICFSHLRWSFVFQRPNHLMSRLARDRRVFFVEEPIFDAGAPRLERDAITPSLTVITPHLPPGLAPGVIESIQRTMLRELRAQREITRPLLWFYTPMALPIAEGIDASAVVYDCMDDLSGFLGAPPELLAREESLLALADVVFTGGHSLFEAKTALAANVHAFPSSVDAEHFGRARQAMAEPEDQRALGGPRIGWFGVIDERLDIELLARVAEERPDHQLVMIGPVVKIDSSELPRRPNIHWLGSRAYRDLPSYIAHWHVAMMPFALNRATRFISPTKTLEYLAAGRPIVSTAIHDVVHPYGNEGLVRVAGVHDFAEAIDAALADDRALHLANADRVLARTSWERTYRQMMQAIDEATCAIPVSLPAPDPVERALDANDLEGTIACTTI